MNASTGHDKIRQNVIEENVKWMENIENEERRKLVNALKRTKLVIDNPTNPKLILAKKHLGDRPLEPIVVKGERHGKPRFSLEYVEKNSLNQTPNFLYPEEAIIIGEKVKVHRSNYAHRIKLAFMFLAGKYSARDNKSFHYSADGDHFTKAYKNKKEVPDGEETICHASAIEILSHDSKINPSAYEQPAFGVSQTKVFRVSSPEHKKLYSEELNYTYTPHTETKISWTIISKQLEDNSPYNRKNGNDKKTYYSCKTLYANETQIKKNKNYKLVWPSNQVKSLIYLLDLCKELILTQSAKTLGEGDQHYAIIYEKKTSKGPEGLLYKALIAQGKDKTEASKTACNAVTNVWSEEGQNKSNPENTAKALTCLSLTDCSLLKYLIESEHNIRFSK